MNEEQREAAERLAAYHAEQADHFSPFGSGNALTIFHGEAAALLRELAAEPVQEPVAAELPAPQLLVESAQGFVEGWTRSQVRSAINLALLKRRYAAPQQPMRCPEDGGACGAGGYCRPEPQQRKPLTPSMQAEVECDCLVAWNASTYGHSAQDTVHPMLRSAFISGYRAAERAHGITGEPT